MNYVNLFGGLARLAEVPDAGFVRIQSTWLEQGRLNDVLADLDYDLLTRLARGEQCVVYDVGERARNGVSRACWQGIPWIQFACAKAWYDVEPLTLVRGHDVTRYFARQFSHLDPKTRHRLRRLAVLTRCGPALVPLLGNSIARAEV